MFYACETTNWFEFRVYPNEKQETRRSPEIRALRNLALEQLELGLAVQSQAIDTRGTLGGAEIAKLPAGHADRQT